MIWEFRLPPYFTPARRALAGALVVTNVRDCRFTAHHTLHYACEQVRNGGLPAELLYYIVRAFVLV